MVLTTLIEIDGQMGWLLLLAPFVVLIIIAIGVIAGRDRAASGSEPVDEPVPVSSAAPAPSAAMRTVTAPTQMLAPTPAQQLPSPKDLREQSVTGSSAPQHPAPAAAPAARQAAIEPPAPAVSSVHKPTPAPAAVGDVANAAALQTIAAHESELLQAEQRFDDAAVARISLRLARELVRGDVHDEVVKSHLRRAIILASRLKDDDTHAAARLELGDIMAKEQDLTSACEHWQIARQIFWDKGAKAAQAEVDQRMMANHCPTDWVLNDF